jgi:hypothetical protein
MTLQELKEEDPLKYSAFMNDLEASIWAVFSRHKITEAELNIEVKPPVTVEVL